MHATTVFVAAALALTAAALPSHNIAQTARVDQVQCGNDQVISCCQTSKTVTGTGNTDGGILSGLHLLDGLNVLGGNCSPLDITAIGGTVPLNHACQGNQAACCTGNQHGLINVQCNNFSLKK